MPSYHDTGFMGTRPSAFPVPIESELGARFLSWRVFFTRTAIRFARKRSSVLIHKFAIADSQ